ncbi:hypothetical protein ACHAWO_011681 [Cyclotella atomus]|uniref:t-SNARE coiled-coil homology domain-containing protein n=1 Tax=Cyclotella atomus TaxID=382360 RepID=A0ABD3PPD0_9STRA
MTDRTAEFFAIANSIPTTGPMKSIHSTPGTAASAPGSSTFNAPGPSASQTNPALIELRAFRTTASEISRDVSTTSSLLAELARLVQSGSTRMFTDESADERADALVLRIKNSVEGLNSRLEEAQYTLERSKRRLGKNSQAGMEASNLVGQLKEEFVKTTSGFKDVLEKRSDGLKNAKDRKRRVFGASSEDGGEERVEMMSLMNKPSVYGDHKASSFGEGGAVSGLSLMPNNRMPSLDLTSGLMRQQQQAEEGIPAGESTSQLPRPHGISSYTNDAAGLRLRHANSAPFDNNTLPTYSGSASSYYPDPHAHNNVAPMTPLDIQRMEQSQSNQRQYQLIPDQDYLRQRADAMSQVESNIVELGTIFNKLAVMVNEHRDLVQRVEDNVDEANANVNLSLGVLADTLRDLQTNRALGMKVMGILVLFIIMFIIFFA